MDKVMDIETGHWLLYKSVININSSMKGNKMEACQLVHFIDTIFQYRTPSDFNTQSTVMLCDSTAALSFATTQSEITLLKHLGVLNLTQIVM